MAAKRKNYRLEPSKLMYSRPCKTHNHHNADGYSVRVIGGPCMACHEGLPPGLTDIQIDGITERITVLHRMTDEERRLGHIEQQKAWNKRNPDKVKKYTSKYSKTPQRLESNRNYVKAQYHLLTLEEKQERNRIGCEKEKIKRENPEYREKLKIARKAKYDALTPEEKKEKRRMQKVYLERRLAKDKELK